MIDPMEPVLKIWVAGISDYPVVEGLMREYVDWLPFDTVDLQDVERELAAVSIK